MSNVVILRWPSQAEEATLFVTAGVACLLLVDPDAAPPEGLGPLEDWERLPADQRDIAVRLRRLAVKSDPSTRRPVVDDHGRLVYRGAWVALSPTEARMARILASRFDKVVTEAHLRSAADEVPAGDGLSYSALRVHVTRLRRRIAPLGLAVRVVRGHGYVLVPDDAPVR